LSWILTYLGPVLGFLLAVAVVAHVIRQKRSPSGTIAWLLVIVLLPYVGVPLYLMLGGRKMKRTAGRKSSLGLHGAGVGPAEQATLIDRLLRTYGIPGAVCGNHLTLCATGEQAYAHLVALIEEASQTLHIATFIFGKDEVGRDILQRLTRRAADGVEVRLLLDDIGSLRTTRRFLQPLIQAGGHVAFFMPVLHLPFRGRTNLRNHRKIVVADGRRVMAGGTNIAGEYIGPAPKPGRWRDLSFILTGAATRHYAELFRSDWGFASGEQLGPEADPPQPAAATGDGAVVQIVPSGPDVPSDALYDAILSTAFAAKRRLWIVTPYFIPDEPLVQALTLACHRGVDVRVLLPRRSDHRLVDLARGPYLRQVQAQGAAILLYTGGMMHAKVMLMDDELAMIGSANVDMRSLFFSYEVAMFVYSAREIRTIEAWIEGVMANSRPGVKAVGTFRDLCEGVARMMAPLL